MKYRIPDFQLQRHSSQYLPAGLVAVAAFGLGAALMYFFDPVSGRNRRAAVRDQAVHYGNEIRETTAATAQDLGNRAKGLYAEARNLAGRNTAQQEEQIPAAQWEQPRV
jgi:hypothetical protein